MGLPVLIYGKSGSGKSRSLKFFARMKLYCLHGKKGAAVPPSVFQEMGSSDDWKDYRNNQPESGESLRDR